MLELLDHTVRGLSDPLGGLKPLGWSAAVAVRSAVRGLSDPLGGLKQKQRVVAQAGQPGSGVVRSARRIETPRYGQVQLPNSTVRGLSDPLGGLKRQLQPLAGYGGQMFGGCQIRSAD